MNTLDICKLWKTKAKCFLSFSFFCSCFKATLGEERDLKNLKSCSTSKALGGVRLKTKDTELIFFHLQMKIQEKLLGSYPRFILFLQNKDP